MIGHGRRHIRGDIGVSVPISAYPGAEADRAVIYVQLSSGQPNPGGDFVQQAGQRLPNRLFQIVTNKAGLVDRVGPLNA